MRRLLAIVIAIFFHGAHAQEANMLYVQAEEKAILSVLAQALDAELPGGVRQDLGWSIGYADQFGDPVSGFLSVAAAIYPFVSTTGPSASTFAVVLNVKTTRGDPQDALAALRSRIAAAAASYDAIVLQDHSNLTPLFQKSIDCIARLRDDPAIAPLVGKFAMSSEDFSAPNAFTNAEKPTTADKTALAAWAKGRDACLSSTLAARRYFLHTRIYGPIEAAFADQAELVRSLAAGKTTFGEFNKRASKIGDDLLQRIKTAAEEDKHDQAIFLGDPDAHDMTKFHATVSVAKNHPPESILLTLEKSSPSPRSP